MANIEMLGHETYSDRRRADRRQYRMIFALAYPLCLGVAGVRRAAEAAGFASADPSRRGRTIFAEARSSTAAAVAFAFR